MDAFISQLITFHSDTWYIDRSSAQLTVPYCMFILSINSSQQIEGDRKQLTCTDTIAQTSIRFSINWFLNGEITEMFVQFVSATLHYSPHRSISLFLFVQNYSMHDRTNTISPLYFELTSSSFQPLGRYGRSYISVFFSSKMIQPIW